MCNKIDLDLFCELAVYRTHTKEWMLGVFFFFDPLILIFTHAFKTSTSLFFYYF